MSLLRIEKFPYFSSQYYYTNLQHISDIIGLDIDCTNPRPIHIKDAEENQRRILSFIKECIKKGISFLTLRNFRLSEELDFSHLIELKLYGYNNNIRDIQYLLNNLNKTNIISLTISLVLNPNETLHIRSDKLLSLKLCGLDIENDSGIRIEANSIKSFKLLDCHILGLHLSEMTELETLKITECFIHECNTLYNILCLDKLKYLSLRSIWTNHANRSLLKRVILNIISKLKPLKKIDLSDSGLGIKYLISCLLSDIEKIVFKGNRVLLMSSKGRFWQQKRQYLPELNKAISLSPVRKLYLDRCSTESIALRIIQRSKIIEKLSLRNIKFIGNDFHHAIVDLIRNGIFRVCDLRFNNLYLSKRDIRHSGINRIIIDEEAYEPNACSLKDQPNVIVTARKQSTCLSSYGYGIQRSDHSSLDIIKNTLMIKKKPLSAKYGSFSDYPVKMFIDLRDLGEGKPSEKPRIIGFMPRNITDLREIKKELKRDIINVRSNEIILSGCIRSFKEIYHPIRIMHIMFPIKRKTIDTSPDFYIVIKEDEIGNHELIKGETIEEKASKRAREIERIPCHKSILSQSDVFRCMFSVPMKESIQGEMVTTNKYYRDFINYLYTGIIEINIENACPLLDIAKMHFNRRLENKIKLFIYKNIEYFIDVMFLLSKYFEDSFKT